MLDLRAQVARQQPALKLAKAKMDLVDKKRGNIRAANDAARRDTISCGRFGPSATATICVSNQSPVRKASQLRQKTGRRPSRAG